jgi:hypothetical protein
VIVFGKDELDACWAAQLVKMLTVKIGVLAICMLVTGKVPIDCILLSLISCP